MAIEPRHARYPFTRAAREAVEAADIDLAAVVERDGPVVDRAVERVERTIRAAETGDPHRRPRVELLSYPVARVLISLIGERALTTKYARAEAATAADRFRADLGGSDDRLKSSRTEPLTLAELLAEFDLDAAVRRVEDDVAEHAYRIAVGPYLELAADREGERWRLVNRRLADGTVPVDRDELLALLETAVRDRVAEGLPLSVPEPIADALAARRDRLREGLADVDLPRGIDTVVPELFPSCMQTLTERARAGPLEPHARFALVSFLVSIGLSAEETVAFLDRGSDSGSAAEPIRHAVEYVRGAAGPTQYAPPSTATLRSDGICPESDQRCERLGNPLAAYDRALGEADAGELAGELVDWRDRRSESDSNSDSEADPAGPERA